MAVEETGVDVNVPAAGDEEDFDQYFEEGVEEEEVVAGPEVEDEDEELDQDEDEEFAEQPQVSKAFAKRLAAKEKQIEERLRTQLLEEMRQQQTSQGQHQYTQPEPHVNVKEQLDKLADELALTPEAVQVLYRQQLMLNQQAESIRKTEEALNQNRENMTKSEVKAEIEAQRKANPMLPEFDETSINRVRESYRKQYGVSLPWKAAYQQFVAEEAMSGNLGRRVQQDTLKKVVGRNKKTVQVKGSKQPAKKPSIDSMSDEQFERMIAAAKSGRLKKS